MDKLIEKFWAGNTTLEERKLLLTAISENELEWTQKLKDEFYASFETPPDSIAGDRLAKILEELHLEIAESENIQSQKGKITPLKKYTRWIAAAAVLVLVSVAGYFFLVNKVETQPALVTKPRINPKNDIAPGGNKAVLTLSDGSQIILNTIENGFVALQGNSLVKKMDDGQLVYQNSRSNPVSSSLQNQAIDFNTITTPKGGQYQLTLPDGTRVWLNAGSSLKFPATFYGNERNVELVGEAYFEVAKYKKMPFNVKTGTRWVEVLGTHFNVRAYEDEKNYEATLLEGSVKVSEMQPSNGSKDTGYGLSVINSKILKPGQQARINNIKTSDIHIISNIDTDEVMAWKDGLFLFNNTNIETAMQQISRWYDAEVVYEGSKPVVKLTGVIPRNNKVSKILNVLEAVEGVKFDIEGKKIIVKSNNK